MEQWLQTRTDHLNSCAFNKDDKNDMHKHIFATAHHAWFATASMREL